MRRGQSQNRRRSSQAIRRSTSQVLEALETRTMMSIAEPNNTVGAPYAVNNGSPFAGKAIFSDFVGASDPVDYYFISTPAPGKLSATLYGLGADADIAVVEDKNHNGQEDAGEMIAQSRLGGTQTDRIENVQVGGPYHYYLKVSRFSGDTNYALDLYLDTAGDRASNARQLTEGGGHAYSEHLDGADVTDVYHVVMDQPSAYFSARLQTPDGTNNFKAELYRDANNNGFLDSSELVAATGLIDGRPSIGNYPISQDDAYYLKVTQTFFSASNGLQNYTLRTNLDYAGSDMFHSVSLGDVTERFDKVNEEIGSTFNTVSYFDPSDFYSLAVTSPATLNLNLQHGSDTYGGPFSAQMELIQDTNGSGTVDSGEVIASSTAGTSGYAFIQRNVGFGQYYVRVTGGPYTNYTIGATADTTSGFTGSAPRYNQSDDIGALVGRKTIDGALGAGDNADTFKFTLPQAGSLQARLAHDGESATYGSLWRDGNNDGLVNGNELIASFDGSVPLVTNSLAAGTYYVSLVAGAHDYSLQLISDFAGSGGLGAKNLGTLGNLVTAKDYVAAGTFFDPDYYKFTLGAGQRMTVNLLGDAGANADIRLFRDLGDSIGSLSLIGLVGGNGTTKQLTQVLPAGKYAVAIVATSGSANYTVGFSAGDNDDSIGEAGLSTANQRSVGQSADFTIDSATDVDLVKFHADRGQTIGFDVDSRNASNVDTFLRLFNGSGTQLATNNNGTAPGETGSGFSYLTYTFGTAGDYYIAVSSAGNVNYNPTNGTGDAGGSSTGQYRLTIANAQPVTSGSIAGTLFRDSNSNGVKDTGEVALGGRTVWADLDNDNVADASEPKATTNGSGNYTLGNLNPGAYKVRQVLPVGWQQTSPASGAAVSVTLASGQNATGKNLGARPITGTASVSGTVFHDFNRNGAKDSGDTGRATWRVYIDANLNGLLDSGETSVLTDASGNYRLSGLSAGTYKVRQQLQSGFVQTTPTSNFGHTPALAAGQQMTGRNFGVDN